MIGSILRTCLVALLASSLAAPIIFRLLLRHRSRQKISQFVQEHAHKEGTPTMGGLIVLVGVFAGIAFNWNPQLLPVSLLTLGFALIGYFDDFLLPRKIKGSRGFDWGPKLVLQIALSVGCLVLAGFQGLDLAVGTFLVLFLCNAYNFSDGLDALSGGLGLLLSVGLLSLCLIAPVGSATIALASVTMPALFGAFLPFLFLNAPPAKVFMGDVGSLPIGGIFGFIVFSGLKSHLTSYGSISLLPWLVILFMMFVEIVPGPIQVASVKLLKRKAFPFKTPVHHGFQAAGWPETRIVGMFHLAQLVCVVLSLWMATELKPL